MQRLAEYISPPVIQTTLSIINTKQVPKSTAILCSKGSDGIVFARHYQENAELLTVVHHGRYQADYIIQNLVPIFNYKPTLCTD